MDVDNFCRTCFTLLHDYRNIFDSENLLDRILKFTDITASLTQLMRNVERGDGLPSNICDICDFKLEVADKFRREVGQSDVRMRAMLAEGMLTRGENSGKISRRSEDGTVTSQTLRAIRNDRPLNRACQQKITTQVREQPFGVPRSRSPSDRGSSLVESVKNGEEVESENESDDQIRDFVINEAFVYSKANGRSLANSYRLLSDYCIFYEVPEPFDLPGDPTVGRGDPIPEVIRSKGEASNSIDQEPRSSSSSRSFKGIRCADIRITRYLETDPLNLLRIGTIEPLDDGFDGRPVEDSGSHPWERSSFSFTSKCSNDTTLTGYRGDTRTPSTLGSKSLRSVSSTRSCPTRNTKRKPSEHPVIWRRKQADVLFGSTCPVCEKTCANSFGVQIHLKQHRSTNCPICDEPTPSKEEFRDHMKIHMRIVGPIGRRV